ncbi:MAG TPA: peptide ABC transporter permease, partial [Thermomicrobiales bacterium]|nr:peptide ABC transporter permease [Thermomicrobiales bacterium]
MAVDTMRLEAAAPVRRRFRTLRRIRRNKLVVFGGLLVALLIFCAIFAPVLAPFSPYEQHNVDQLLPPGGKYPLGTDEFGRDMLSRVLFGARISIQVAAISVSIGLIFGGVLGLVASYFGGV